MPIFYHKRNGYDIDLNSIIDIEELSDNNKTIIFPIEIDTEFQPKHALTEPTTRLKPTIIITNQLRAIEESEGVIFAHSDITSFARHPILQTGFSPIDYLKFLGEREGFRVKNFTRHTGENAKSLHRTHNKKGEKIEALPVLEIVCYAFYAVAELGKIALGAFNGDLVALARANAKQARIEQKRRLRTDGKPNKDGFSRDFINMPWSVDIENQTYRIRICIIDTCAVHGVASYAGFCEATGVKLKYKDNFTSAEKGEMAKMYQERPEDFDNYALGDLYNYKALSRNVTLFQSAYESLGLSEYFQKPRLTIGATVRDLFQARIAKEFEIPNKKKLINALLEKVCEPANANWLKTQVDTTLALNAKVRGGRCRNNKPTHTRAVGMLADIDINGCYGEGQRNQLMLFGNPVKLHYPINKTTNKHLTLRQFLKQYGNELVYGAWQAVVSSTERLKHSQDFVNSWIEPKDFREIANLQTETDTIDKDELDDWLEKEIGSTKIYNHQIINGLINHDFLDWLNNICAKEQRAELLDKLIVRTALIYPASERVESAEKLIEKIDNWQEGNTVELKISKGKTKAITNSQECHAWYGVNMGDFLITDLLKQRKKAKKEHGAKSPQQTLYKLCINTLYGDMVSPYFTISNVVVGNNITARARALAWYMEKGLNGWQSITDGCVIDLNKVVFPVDEKRKLTGENIVNFYREEYPYRRYLALKPLTDSAEIEFIEWENGTPKIKIGDKTIDNAHQWIADKTWEHLQQVFPNVSVLHAETTDIDGNPRKGMFSFEVKECYTDGVFHGTANYLLGKPGCKPTIKMRSYESKKHHERYTIQSDELVRLTELENQPPSEFFLKKLLENPYKIPRGKTFMKTGILKCAEYAERYTNKYSKTRLTPGDTIFKIGLLKELSLSQFTFQTREQCESWEREMESLKRKYGQSYEMFFTDLEGNLNYQEMIETIDKAIADGKMGLDFKRKDCTEHSELSANELLKSELEKAYLIEETEGDYLEGFIVEDGYDNDLASYEQEIYEMYKPGVAFEGNLDDFEFDLNFD